MGNAGAFTWNVMHGLSERANAAQALAIHDAHAGELRGKSFVLKDIEDMVAG
jgi:hypothetical protein